MNQSFDELYHMGRPGMKWGIRRGPPYPIDSKKVSIKKKKTPKNVASEFLSKYGSGHSLPKMSQKEKSHVEHEIMTWMTKAQRESKTVFDKAIGKYVYTIQTLGGNDFKIIKKRPNKK